MRRRPTRVFGPVLRDLLREDPLLDLGIVEERASKLRFAALLLDFLSENLSAAATDSSGSIDDCWRACFFALCMDQGELCDFYLLGVDTHHIYQSGGSLIKSVQFQDCNFCAKPKSRSLVEAKGASLFLI